MPHYSFVLNASNRLTLNSWYGVVVKRWFSQVVFPNRVYVLLVKEGPNPQNFKLVKSE